MCTCIGGMINVQEDLSRFSWYKVSMSREEAESKVRDYREVRLLARLSLFKLRHAYSRKNGSPITRPVCFFYTDSVVACSALK